MMLTRKQWREAFLACGLHAGSIVLLQLDEGRAKQTAGGIETVLEALTEIVTREGLVLVPAFSRQWLDPLCDEEKSCAWEDMVEYRRSLYGYDPNRSEADSVAVQLQKMGGRRSDHPSFSYVLWGKTDEDMLEQPLDFPVSFEGMLSVFSDSGARNILAGIPWDDSLLVSAIAHLVGRETVSLEKAWLHRPKRTLSKTYLVSHPDPDVPEDLIQTETVRTDAGRLQVLSLYSSPEKTKEIWMRNQQ